MIGTEAQVRIFEGQRVAIAPWLGAQALATSHDFHRTPDRDLRLRAKELRKLLSLGEGEHLVFAEQTHGPVVFRVPDEGGAGMEAMGMDYLVRGCDGLVTGRRDMVLCVRTADCLPIAIWDPRSDWVGVVHAGWRGTHEEILARALKSLKEAGGVDGLEGCQVWVGPGVSGENYEVSEELAASFEQRFGCGVRGRNLNLGEVNRRQARRAGVLDGDFLDCGLCTVAMVDTFPSHRRQGLARGQIYTVVRLANGGQADQATQRS